MPRKDLQNWVLMTIWSFFTLLTVRVFTSDEKERGKNDMNYIFIYHINQLIGLNKG